jgi:hypothetical protein
MSHEDCRRRICIVCVSKKQNVRPISKASALLIEEHYLTGLDFQNDERLPVVICSTCRQALCDRALAKKHHNLPPVYDYRDNDYCAVMFYFIGCFLIRLSVRLQK